MSERPDEETPCDGCGALILRKADRVQVSRWVFCSDVCAESFQDEHGSCDDRCNYGGECNCTCHTETA